MSLPRANSSLNTSVCLIVLMWGLTEARPFVLPVLIAAFLAFLMAPLHGFLVKRLKIHDGFAVVMAAIIFLSPLVLLTISLIHQGKSLIHDVPQLISTAEVKLQEFTANNPLASTLGLDLDKLSSAFGQSFGMVVGGLAAVADVGSQIVLIFIFSTLFLASRVHLRQSAEHILMNQDGFDGPHLLDQAADLIQRFLIARMTIVIIIGTLATLALSLFGVQYSIFLGTLFGILTLVPAVGSLTGLITSGLTALITGHSFGSTLIIVAVLFCISSLENYYLTPKMVGNRLNLNALTCFIGLFAFGLMWGIWGMFLSIPILGVLRIIFCAIPRLRGWGELIADKTDDIPLNFADAHEVHLRTRAFRRLIQK